MNECLKIREKVCKGGYILLPRMLVRKMFSESDAEMTEVEAFVCMLLSACYQEIKRDDKLCGRGESIISVLNWSHIFKWKVWKTRKFFQELEENGNIEIVKNGMTNRIRMADYDLMCFNKRPAEGETEAVPHDNAPKSKLELLFNQFWEKYYETTGLDPIGGKVAAMRAWKQLKPQERLDAINGIDDYFYGLTNVKYTKQAVNYLRDRMFQDS